MKTILTQVLTKKGNYFEVMLPAKKCICLRCDGEGKHVNPSIDGHGLSAEDLSDDDFRESYFRGDYDVNCSECNGEKIVIEVDYEKLTPKMKDRYDRMINQRNIDESEAEGERRMGA